MLFVSRQCMLDGFGAPAVVDIRFNGLPCDAAGRTYTMPAVRQPAFISRAVNYAIRLTDCQCPTSAASQGCHGIG